MTDRSPSAAAPWRRSRNRIRHEPRWYPEAQLFRLDLLPGTRNWLLDDGSLTGRLIDLDQGGFSVQRLYQGWEVPLPSEWQLLGVPPQQLALVREVALRLGDRHVVFARSVLPVSSLAGALAHLRRLQNRPLGAILFGHPGMRRGPFEVAQIPGHGDYLPREFRQGGPAWCRRSRFEIEGGRLMVSEVFLESFRPWSTLTPVHRSQRGKVSAAIVRTKQ